MEKFRGEFRELEALVSGLGYKGQWADDNGKRVFRSDDKAVLNWWPSTGTLQFQGPTTPHKQLEDAVAQALSGDPPEPVVAASTAPAAVVEKPSPPISSTSAAEEVSERIFVVYGHDEAACEQLELLLHRLDLDPFVLGNTSGSGLTIIEALEKEILSPNRGKRFGIVLLYGEHRRELSGGYRLTTNNRMELMGPIKGLEALNQSCRVTVHSDSQYVVEGIEKGWAKRWRSNGWMRNKRERAINPDLWGKLLDLCETHEVEFLWVHGHAGDVENERCDHLAVEAAHQKDLPVDEEYETPSNA